MSRLSRTQKFQDYRDQLSNDKEENFNTQDLSSYQNRLNGFQSDLGSISQNTNNYQQPTFNQAPQANYQQPAFNQAPVNNFTNETPVYQNYGSSTQENNGVYGNTPTQNTNQYAFNENIGINSYMNNQAPAFAQNNNNAPAFNNQYQETEVNTPKQQGYAFDQTASYETPFMQQAQYKQPVEQAKPQAQDQGSFFFDNFLNGGDTNNYNTSANNDFNSYFESNNFSNNSVFNDVKDNSDARVSQKERDTYLNQAINDANAYNMNNGQATINSILDNSVNEVRHNDNFGIDDEFSSTVSMEISHIMDEVSAPQAPTYVNQPINPIPVQVNNNVTEEKVVEIKNINEIKNEPVNTMSNTIPFVVAAEDEEVLDEDDEGGSNTVLNVILIVLIIVLIAVLGLIVFYILKTKGIL